MSTLSVVSRRGDHVESRHRVSVAVVDRAGARVAAAGDPALPTFLRSAAKPFQALPLVADGVADRFAMTDEEIALACASHNGTARHIAVVRGLLERIGRTEADLVCGPHRPLAVDLAVRPRDAPPPAESAPRTPITSNCSGKHAGMLALAAHHDWPVAGYHRADHPVQGRCREELARWTRVPAAEIGEAIDGCGVVCFRVPLERMAAAFACLGVSDEPAARRIVHAMTADPDLVGGEGRLDTAAMRTWPGQVLAKVGADGVYGVALPERGLGIALKVEDGHPRAAMVALIAVLGQLGLDPSPAKVLSRFASFATWNTRDEQVGSLHADGALTFE